MTTDAGTSDARAAWIGLSMCAVAALGASSGGVFVRMIGEESEWAVLFWRSVSFILVVLAYLAVSDSRRRSGPGRRSRPAFGLGDQLRRPGFLLAAVFLGLAFIFYVIAMNRTTVGNVLLILSGAPFAIALIRRVFFGAAISRGTWASMVVGGAGVVIVVVGNATVSFDAGIVFALAATLCYAGFVICLGSQGGGDFMWSIVLAGVIAAVISATVATVVQPGGLFLMRPEIIAYACLMGVFQLAVQYILMTKAAGYVPPETISLVLLLEVVLGPIWVWALFGETLGVAALVAFPLILGASVANVFFSGARHRRPVGRQGA